MTRKKITLTDLGIKLKDLERLEDCLICVPLCEKHNRRMGLLYIKGREKEAEALEDSWKSCKKCKAIHDDWWHGAWRVQGKLFELVTSNKRA